MTNKTPLLLLFFISVSMLGSCSAFRFAKHYTALNGNGGSLSGGVFTDSSNSYRIGHLGSTWNRVNSDYGDLLFVNESRTAAITVNSTCSSKKTDYSLLALSNSLLIGVKNKELVDRELINIDKEEAMFAAYRIKDDKENLHIATAVFKKGICIYDFSYSDIGESFDQQLKIFVSFLNDFEVLQQQ